MPNWDEIRREWESNKITFKALAEKHGVKEGTLKSRRSRERWSKDATNKKDATISKKMQPEKERYEPVVQNEDLTEKQKLFCIYYIKSFNQTIAAIKAGYAPDSAHVRGSELVRNSKVATEIRRLKGEMQQGVFVDAMDVLNKYIQIAFADITDYATFGKKEVQVMAMYGPLEDDDGNPIMEEVNYVDFNESNTIDGSIITEVKQGRDGISVKLADKMKALDMLTKYFDLLSDGDKRRLEQERIKVDIAKTKAETSRIENEAGTGDIENIVIVDEWTDEDE